MQGHYNKNYYNTVYKELFQCDDYFFRYEFAKSRGQIHTHGILFSNEHAKKIEQALDLENDNLNDEERASNLEIESFLLASQVFILLVEIVKWMLWGM